MPRIFKLLKQHSSFLKNEDVFLYGNKLKSEFILTVFTFIALVIIITFINLLIISVYKVDEKQLTNELAGLFLEKYRFGLWPEPVERAQFFITVLASPLIIFIIYQYGNMLLKHISDIWIDVIFHFSFFISFLLILALINFDLKLNPDNFISKGHPIFYKEIRNFVSSIISGRDVWFVLVSLPIVFHFIKLDIKGPLLRITKIIIYAMLGALLIDIFLINIFNRDNYFGWNEHFNAVYYSLVQVVNGKTLLVDFANQYGLYPHFLGSIFRHVELNVLNYSIVMSSLVVLSYIFILLFLINSINNIGLVFLGFVGLVYLRLYLLAFFNYGDSYFQYTPIRFIFPCLFLLLVSYYFKNFNKKLYYIIFIISSISILWNIDTGLIVFLTWLAALCFNELFDFKIKSILKECSLHILYGLAILFITLLTYGILIYERSGSFPDYSLLIKYQKIFYQSGFFMMHMPLFNAWNLIALIYGIGLIRSVKSLINNDKTYRNTIVFLLSIIGIGISSYYQGRSHDFNLTAVNYPAFILLIIYADDLVKDIQIYGCKVFSKVFYLLLILFFLLIFAFNLSQFNLIYKLSASRLSSVIKNELSNSILTDNILFLKENTSIGEAVLILTEPGFEDGVYYGETRTVNAANVPGFSELMLQEDFDKIIRFLKSNKNIKVFIDSRFSNNIVHQILLDNYMPLDQNDDMKLYLPTKAAQAALNGPYLDGTAECHLTLPQETMVKNLDNFPTTRPLAKIQIELTDSANLKNISVYAIGRLGNDIGNWTTKPISHLWGIGIADDESLGKMINIGPRNKNLNLAIGRKLTLVIPDNGNLSKLSSLKINLNLNKYKQLSIITSCN